MLGLVDIDLKKGCIPSTTKPQHWVKVVGRAFLPLPPFRGCCCGTSPVKRGVPATGEGMEPLLPLPARLPPWRHFQCVPVHRDLLERAHMLHTPLERWRELRRLTLPSPPPHGSAWLEDSGECGGVEAMLDTAVPLGSSQSFCQDHRSRSESSIAPRSYFGIRIFRPGSHS